MVFLFQMKRQERLVLCISIGLVQRPIRENVGNEQQCKIKHENRRIKVKDLSFTCTFLRFICLR